MPYEFLDDLATADIAFAAWGKNLEEAFVAAADATMNVMIENLDSIQHRESREIHLRNEALDLLLFDLLQELIYYKDAETLLLRIPQAQIHIGKKDGFYLLEAVAVGENLDLARHHPRVDVKAVTLHRFRLEETDRGWQALVILDI